MTKKLTLFEKNLHRSTDLVKKFGEQRPFGKSTLRELFMIDGISMWDVMTVEIVLYHIPNVFGDQSRTFRQILMNYLRPLKYAFYKKLPIDNSDCARWPSGKTALFLGFTGYMARDVLQPVVDMLIDENDLIPVLLTEEAKSTSDTPTFMHSAQRHRGPETGLEARQFAKSVRKAYSILTHDEQYRSIFADEGRELWPFIKEGLFRTFKVQAGYHLPDVIAVARHILTVHKPAVIVSIDTADPKTRVYSLLGAMLGIPTVQIQSGGVAQEAVEWQFLLDDIVAIQGESSRGVFITHGVPPEKMYITGSPRYDSLRGATKSEISLLRQRFSIPPENCIVVLASSYCLDYSSQNKKIAEYGLMLRNLKKAVFMAVAAVPGISLIVKPHPLENVAETRGLAENNSRIYFAEPAEDVRSLASACDAFFTFGSTATLDALILEKPTVCPALPGWIFSDFFIRTGAVAVPRSESEIVDVLKEILVDGGAEILRRHESHCKEYLSSAVCAGGQGASRRIVELLKGLTQPDGQKQKRVAL